MNVTGRLRTYLKKTNWRYALRGGFWLTIAKFTASASAFVMAILFANLVPAEIYGTYKYVLSLAAVAGIFALPGLDTAITQAVARGYTGSIRPALASKIHWSAVAAVVCVGMAVWHWWWGPDHYTAAIGLLIVAFLIPIYESSNQFAAIYLGKKDFKAVALANVGIKIAAFIVMALAAWLTPTVVILVAAYYAIYGISRCYALWRALKETPANGAADPDVQRYGFHLSVQGLIENLAAQLDKILVYGLLGPQTLALYSFAVAAPEQVKGVLGSLDSLLFPKYATYDTTTIARHMPRKFLQLTVLGVVVIGGYILVAPTIYQWFFPQYTAAIPYSQVFALSMLNLIFFPATTYLKAKKRVQWQYASSIIAPTVQIVAMIGGIWIWGLWGLIGARVISRFFASLLNLLFFYLDLRHTTPDNAPPAATM